MKYIFIICLTILFISCGKKLICRSSSHVVTSHPNHLIVYRTSDVFKTRYNTSDFKDSLSCDICKKCAFYWKKELKGVLLGSSRGPIGNIPLFIEDTSIIKIDSIDNFDIKTIIWYHPLKNGTTYLVFGYRQNPYKLKLISKDGIINDSLSIFEQEMINLTDEERKKLQFKAEIECKKYLKK